jgi:exo-beta-1,3-glucanase (GH17 family)
LCSYLNAHGGGDNPNGAVGNQGADLLIVNITDTRNVLKNLGLSLPVGNSDAGSYFNNKVLAAVDYGVRSASVSIVVLPLTFISQLANVHPWFGNVTVQAGPQWTWDFFNQTDVTLANSLPNKPEMSIAEVGWPTVRNLTFE